MALSFSSTSTTGFALSDAQIMVLQGRYLGFNVIKMGEITGRVPSTLSEHLQRAYQKLGFHKITEVKLWIEESGNKITEDEWRSKFGKRTVKPVDEIKTRNAEQEREEIVNRAQAEAMSSILLKGRKRNHARYQ